MEKLPKTANFVAKAALLCGISCFVLREYGEKIALFRESEPQPIAVYETPAKSLYPADEALLREGIRVKTEGEITRLIEDLGLEQP